MTRRERKGEESKGQREGKMQGEREGKGGGGGGLKKERVMERCV